MKTAEIIKDRYSMAKISLVVLLLVVFALLLFVPKDLTKGPSIIGKVFASVRIVSGFAPTFDQNLTNQSVLQSGRFFYDVNCSDVELFDTVIYYTNFTGFEINSSTGIINQSSFLQQYVGNNTVSITCGDGRNNATQTFILEIIDTNNAPVLSSIGAQIATEGQLFVLNLSATDSENDNLTFSAATSLFTVDPLTGGISFTPTLAQVGNYTINFSVSDGTLDDWEIVSFRIVRGPFCGDTSCGNGETCESCNTDCGSCPEGPPPESVPGTSSGTGGAGTSGITGQQPLTGLGPAPYYRCEERWECSEWNVCTLEGFKTRKCRDINRCNTKNKKPGELDSCEYSPTCIDGIQNGDEDGVDCGGSCEPCLTANCFDGIQNQNEEGIDCGGPCRACAIRPPEREPFVEIPGIIRIPRQFPWILIIIMAILLAMTITSDQMYMHKIKKRKFDDFKEALAKYRPFRRKVFRVMIDAPVITLIISLHIFYFSTDFGMMLWFSWLPIGLIFLLPALVSWIYVHYTYYEYKRKQKELMLKVTHKREIRQLIGVENRVLMDLENKTKSKIFHVAEHHKFEKAPEFYKEINPVYGIMSSLVKRRKNRMDISRINSEMFRLMIGLRDSKIIVKIGKDYPEFMAIQVLLTQIIERINFDTSDIEEELMAEIKNISSPYMLLLIKANNFLVPIYNSLVDIYNYLAEKHSKTDLEDDEISKIERSFTDGIKSIAKKANLIDAITKDSDFADIYNSMMDLFNHYGRKQELAGKIKGL